MTSARVLIVDDESDTELLFTQKFHRQVAEQQYTLFFATNGVEALKILEETPDMDIVITETHLPIMDGLTLIGHVTEKYPLIRPIVISAYSDLANLRAAMNKGAHDFVLKPVDFEDLQATIDKTFDLVSNLKKAQKSQQRLNSLTDELDVSAHLQRSILPGNIMKKPPFEVYADTHPAAEVGGDFYDFFWLDDTHLGVVIADVSGKNISAALFMTMTRTLLKCFSRTTLSPAACLTSVNEALVSENPTFMFVTAFYGIIDATTGILTYANAGHLPPVLFGPTKEPTLLKEDPSLALGIDATFTFTDYQCPCALGGGFFLYTDGVVEANNIAEEEYGFDRFLACLRICKKDASPQEITESIIESVRAFAADAVQSDDITTLCLRYEKS
ncbi:MAG: SpoIIE family protein phosphatase [Holosporales bacterium]|jgi:sigma-B regulation protein RsbU (phosphoserine phosphatase)|nr:SpoIIE family protein phosphatase [Holosporales bacterium]